MGNLNGARDVRNCSDSFGHRLGYIRLSNISRCDLLISKMILKHQKRPPTLRKFGLF